MGEKEDLDPCGKSSDGAYVTWEPYLDLLNFMKKYENKRMTYYFFLDTEEGQTMETQLKLTVQDWTTKFAIMDKLPFEAKADTSMAFFKKVAKQNEINFMIKNLLRTTRNAILAKKDLSKNMNPKKMEKEVKDVVAVWENLREFLDGLYRFKWNLDDKDFDGST